MPSEKGVSASRRDRGCQRQKPLPGAAEHVSGGDGFELSPERFSLGMDKP